MHGKLAINTLIRRNEAIQGHYTLRLYEIIESPAWPQSRSDVVTSLDDIPHQGNIAFHKLVLGLWRR